MDSKRSRIRRQSSLGALNPWEGFPGSWKGWGVVFALVLGLLSSACHTTGRSTRSTRPASVRSPGGSNRQRDTTPPGTPARPIPTQAWEREVTRWIGTPYRPGGTSHDGMDCSGFILVVYRNVAGLALPRTTAQQSQCGVSVSRASIAAGDLLFFAEPGRGIGHVGLSLGRLRFAHASVHRGVTVSRLDEPYYAARHCGSRRVLR